MTMAGRAQAIADRAMQQLGTPFRPFGRQSGIALDCVGLTLCAIDGVDCNWRYHLKGSYDNIIKSYLENYGLDPVVVIDGIETGDVGLFQCGPQHQHLMIFSGHGWIHAHAGLGRVVHMPTPSPWPIIALWRALGD
jgi:murein DD-endopeptidase / murein LD-carboxypeptidase